MIGLAAHTPGDIQIAARATLGPRQPHLGSFGRVTY